MKFSAAFIYLSVVCLAAAGPVAKPSDEIRAVLFNPETLETREVMVNRYSLKTRLTDGALEAFTKRSPQITGNCVEMDNCACGGRK